MRVLPWSRLTCPDRDGTAALRSLTLGSYVTVLSDKFWAFMPRLLAHHTAPFAEGGLM